SALYFMMDEKDIDLAMKQPWVSVGTDASAADSTADPETAGRPHPRSYGTFPRIIAEYVQARAVLTLPDAIRKMTGWPAQRLGLADRGLLREGMRADIVVFDMGSIKDNATFEAPTAAPAGIDDVIVNGVVALAKGQPTGSRSGTVLRHTCPAA